MLTLDNFEKNYRGSAARMSKIRMKGVVGEWARLRAAIENFTLSIADSGVLTTVSKGIVSLTTALTKLSKTNPDLLKFGTYAAIAIAALAPLGLIISGVAGALALLTSPLALVAGGMAYLAAVNWDRIKLGFSAFTAGFDQAIEPSSLAALKRLKDYIGGFFTMLDSAEQNGIEFTASMRELGRDTADTIDTIVSAFEKFGNAVDSLSNWTGIDFSWMGKMAYYSAVGAFGLNMVTKPIKILIKLLNRLSEIKIPWKVLNFLSKFSALGKVSSALGSVKSIIGGLGGGNDKAAEVQSKAPPVNLQSPLKPAADAGTGGFKLLPPLKVQPDKPAGKQGSSFQSQIDRIYGRKPVAQPAGKPAGDSSEFQRQRNRIFGGSKKLDAQMIQPESPSFQSQIDRIYGRKPAAQPAAAPKGPSFQSQLDRIYGRKPAAAAPAGDGGGGAARGITPKLDTGPLKQQAATAAGELQSALSVTAAPVVDSSSIDAALGKAMRLRAMMNNAGGSLSALSAGPGPGGGMSPGAGGPLPKKATGGALRRGMTYQINERGTETVTMGVNGMMAPAGRGGGQTTIAPTININSTDPRGAAQEVERVLSQLLNRSAEVSIDGR